MITTLTSVRVAPERTAEFETVWNSAHEYARRQAGYHDMRLLRDVAQPGHYIALNEWDSRDDFDRFARTSGMNWLERGLQLWQTLPAVDFEEVQTGAVTDKGG